MSERLVAAVVYSTVAQAWADRSKSLCGKRRSEF